MDQILMQKYIWTERSISTCKYATQALLQTRLKIRPNDSRYIHYLQYCNYIKTFFFALLGIREENVVKCLRSPKTSPECVFVALQQVLCFSSPFKVGTVTTGSDKLLQLWPRSR